MSDNIAHDLRSPIARIRGLAEVTLTTGKSLGEYENMAASTVEECDRLLDMINTMLFISKTEAGVEKPSRAKVDIAALIHSACELFEPIAEDKNVTLKCQTLEQTFLPGDARMLQRMLSNILDNAVKYTPPGGRVEVYLSTTSSGDIVLAIHDTGIGISEDDQNMLFTAFHRGANVGSRAGTGLGLMLVKRCVELHHGQVRIESKVGQGTTVTVRLPIFETNL
jgi:signal transduction histidine kinase